jgi:hypothetical protein
MHFVMRLAARTLGGEMQTVGEQRMRELVGGGDRADLSDLPEIERRVPASVLTEVLQSTAHARLVEVTGAHFVGCWDLEHLTCETPVRLMSCWFDMVPVLRFASLPALAFEDCDLPGLEGERLEITHHLELIASRVGGQYASPVRASAGG